MIPLEHILYISGALFAVGIFGLLWQTNLLRLLIAVEAMINGAAFAFVGTAVHFNNVDGYMMFIMILPVAAPAVGIGLAIVLHSARLLKTLDVSKNA